jgi:flavin-dependent dehydrogenase
VAVIGGGPAGVAAALTLKDAAKTSGTDVTVFLFEPKRFGEHLNQCLGVLSSPLLSILSKDFGIELPRSLIQREISGYVLTCPLNEVILDCESEGELSHAVRRVQFDAFLLETARERGVNVVSSRVADIEVSSDSVMVYSDSGNWKVSAVIGAFGLDHAAAAVFTKRTAYRPPEPVETVVTKVHPAGLDRVHDLLSDRIYVYLPSIRRIEFGALIPKGNHISIVIAGKDVKSGDMDAFLALPEVAKMLPPGCCASGYYKGSFPLGLASGIYGDRYVVVGDAAGLVRPFKGKGINTALLTGRLAALTMLEKGVSARALRSFYDGCADLRADVVYGRFMRFLAVFTSNHLSMDRVIALAKRRPDVRQALFDCVSGSRPFKDIVTRNLNLPFVSQVLKATLIQGWAHRTRR